MQEVIAQLTPEEGDKLHVYDDATGLPIGPGTVVQGHPTISRGVKLDAPGGLDENESAYLTINRINDAVTELDQALPWWKSLNDARQRILIDMTYNMGIGGLLGFHDMLDYLHLGEYDLASIQMLNSEWDTEVKARAAHLAEIMKTGVWV